MAEKTAIDVILHCQRQIAKGPPEAKLLHYLGRLSRLRITVQDLAETGIGRTVNQLRANEGPVGPAADTLVLGWKRMATEQQNQVADKSEESDPNSNTETSEDDEEEEDEVNNVEEPYVIPDQEEVVVGNPEQQYRNGHSSNEERRDVPTDPPSLQSKTSGEEEEDDDADDGNDSVRSDRLQIADESEKASSSSSSEDLKYYSSKSHNYGKSKERTVKHGEAALEHKSHHHQSISKSEKSKEYKSENSSSSESSHHNEKDRNRQEKHSKEISSPSSQHEKDGKSEKERHKDKRASSDHHQRDERPMLKATLIFQKDVMRLSGHYNPKNLDQLPTINSTGNRTGLQGVRTTPNWQLQGDAKRRPVSSGAKNNLDSIMKKDGECDEWGKLFIGGLNWQTSSDGLQRYFSRFGEVVDAVVMKNPETGRSKGFGFVTFRNPANVDAVLNSGPHQLDGRTIDPKMRIAQKRKRDSCESDDPVERLVAEHFVNSKGKRVEIKRVEPRDGRGGGMGRQSGWGAMMGNQMGHMGPPGGMTQGYQGWGTPPQQSGYPPQGYNPGGGQSYQGWGAAQATQGQQMPQWGSYGATPQQSYGYGTTPQNSYGANLRYTMGQNGQSGGATPQGADMYGRQGTTPTAAPGTPAAPAQQKPTSSYPYSTPQPQYGSSAGYTHTQPPQHTAARAYGPSRAYGTGSISGYRSC